MTSQSPPLPWKTRLLMYILSTVTDASRRSNYTVNRYLSFLDRPTSPNSKPLKNIQTFDISINPSLWFRIFLPTSTPSSKDSKLPVLVFFHGGGFAFLSAATFAYDAVCRRFARKLSAIVISVNYRLSPEHKFPAQYDDGVNVLRYLDSNTDSNPAPLDSADLSNCFLIGDSAGGNIAHHVARRWAGEGDWNKVTLRGIVAIQPFFGGEERTESEITLANAPLVTTERSDWLWKVFLPEGEDRDHPAVNVFGKRMEGELEKKFPAAMVVVGGWDPLKDWQRRYVEGLRERGREVKLVEYENAVHAFYVFPELEDGRKLIEEIKGFTEGQRVEG